MQLSDQMAVRGGEGKGILHTMQGGAVLCPVPYSKGQQRPLTANEPHTAQYGTVWCALVVAEQYGTWHTVGNNQGGGMGPGHA